MGLCLRGREATKPRSAAACSVSGVYAVAWLQPCQGLAGGPGPSPGQLSPLYVHRPPQMTAWAHWSWTSGRTSPSSPIRPASESEQPPAAAMGRTQAAAITAGGFFFSFFFQLFILPFLFVSPSLTCSPSFPVFPSALLTSAVLAALPPGSRPALTFVTDQDSGASPLPAQDQGKHRVRAGGL